MVVVRINTILLYERHCEARSNPKLYRAALLIGDCFVPRNDISEMLRRRYRSLQRKIKRTARSYFAIYTDLASLGLNKIFGNGKA